MVIVWGTKLAVRKGQGMFFQDIFMNLVYASIIIILECVEGVMQGAKKCWMSFWLPQRCQHVSYQQPPASRVLNMLTTC